MQKWRDLNLSTCRNNDFCVCLLKFKYKIIPKNSKKKKSTEPDTMDCIDLCILSPQSSHDRGI